MGERTLKTKEERLWEMLIKDYITETEYFKMMQRIKAQK